MDNNTKILVAIDSFKGTLSSIQSSNIIREGIRSSNPDINVITVPIADGGEGTVDSFVVNMDGKYIEAVVHDPLFRKIKAKYGLIEGGDTAVIEMAAASGLELLLDDEKNPLYTSTFGTGELILDAVKNGVKNLLIGIGGSATNDGGTGMASALGIQFLSENNELLKTNGSTLSVINKIDTSELIPLLSDVSINVLCDVTNPLLGNDGASFVYGPQKGASEEEVIILDKGLRNLSEVVRRDLKKDYENYPGSGAAGGLGYGLLTFLDARISNGINFLLECFKLEDLIRDVDFVITGEGKMDSQTSFNKAPWGIMKLAKKHNKKVIGIAGIIRDDGKNTLADNFDYLYPLVSATVSIENSMRNPELHLKNITKKIVSEIFT